MRIERKNVEMQKKMFEEAVKIHNKLITENPDDYNFGVNVARFCVSLFVSSLMSDADKQNALQILYKSMQLDLQFIEEFKIERQKDEA